MKLTKLNMHGFSHHIVGAFAVLAIAITGTGLLVASHAMVPSEGGGGTPLAAKITKTCHPYNQNFEKIYIYQPNNGYRIDHREYYGIDSTGKSIILYKTQANFWSVGNLDEAPELSYYAKYFVRTVGSNGLHADSAAVVRSTAQCS